MPDATTDRPVTMQEYLDYTWRHCRSVDADYRWTADDMTTAFQNGATAYAATYEGRFDFMVDMRAKARRGTLTAGQAKGVMNCMMAEVRRQRAASVPPVVVDMSALMTLFQRAGTRLQRPRVTLSGVTLKLSTRGQFPGTIGLTAGAWPNSIWLGRIGRDGTLTRGRNMTDDVLTLIRELAENPVAAAQRYASLTGNCCFCNLRLTDERSTQAGYGPICAQHYGLPWGDREGLVATPEGFTYRDEDGATRVGADITQFGPTIHMCHECPAFGICQEQGECRGGVVA